jgi:hypothetical protein
MLAALSISMLHPFLLDCNFHAFEEVFDACNQDTYYSKKFLIDVISQILSGADLCGSILPYGLFLNEIILSPRELITAT